ncbi:MAG TPA: inner membrane CreD family protein [Candidatus Limnocylindrales bacterium]|nr:inner membrane CreD family protein [Candidatus Limnocylindrales bacterium]
MFKRIAAIGFIFLCTTGAWAILGSTVFYRTYSLNSELRGRVASTWGAPQAQAPPTATYVLSTPKQETTTEDGKQITRTVQTQSVCQLPLEKSRVNVDLHLDYRRKGLLWYSTYGVQFAGSYEFQNTEDVPRDVTFTLHLPAEQAIYDGVSMSVNGAPLALSSASTDAYGTVRVQPHQTAALDVAYRSQGLESWKYNFGNGVNQVKDFELRVATDFKGFDFPENTLSPTQERPVPNGWELVWNYKNLVSGYTIGVAMPEKLQPGPLTGRISYFAPVSLLFFFFVLFTITTIRGIELHPMNYFFLACAFFSFHLLMAYLVDHISIHLAFLICSCVSVFLVVSYLRLVVGMRFAAVEAGLAQFVYLILFSYAFFFEGFTGLAITIGAILSLFVAMQVTGRVRWAEKFATRGTAAAFPR